MVPVPDGGVPASMKPVYMSLGSSRPSSLQPGSDVTLNFAGGAGAASSKMRLLLTPVARQQSEANKALPTSTEQKVLNDGMVEGMEWTRWRFSLFVVFG